jgi:O-antigen/teichoic acid export membrane protein
MIANLYQLGEMDRLNELYKISTKWGIYLSIPVFLFICFTSQEIMVGLFGIEYIAGALPLVILIIGQMINVSTGAVGFILIMTGYERLWLIISVFSFALNVALNVMLVPQLGLIGAAIATAIAIGTLYLSGLFAVRRLIGLWPYDTRYKKGLFAAASAMIALILLRLFGIENVWLSIFINALTSVLVFVAVFWRLGLDSEDREFLTLLLKKIRGSHV